MKYRSEIDGLRAIAVVPVILFHAGFEIFSGGFVGVDVFFVISGYLITTIIINEMDEGKFSLLSFYERRARRILPALFFVVLCCIPFAWFLLLPSDMKDFSQSLVAVATFSSNILFWRESGYFDTAAELKPLLHTWSLAVEEQFYILFPLFLMAAWRFEKRAIVWTLVAAFVISLATAQWGAYNRPTATFYLLPTRAWELLVGSFAAFYLQKRTVSTAAWFNNVLSAIGLAAILYSVFAFDDATPFPSLYALVPTVGTVLIILFAVPGTAVHSLLSMRGFVGVGLISYSLYLWHQPVFAFWRHYNFFEPTHVEMVLLALLSVCLAYCTYRFVEAPFRRNANVITRGKVLVFSVTFLSLVFSVGLYGHTSNGLSSRYAQDVELIYSQRLGWQDDDDCYFSGSEFQFEDVASCVSPNSVFLVGDSHAESISGILRAELQQSDIQLVTMTHPGCLPVPATSRTPISAHGSCAAYKQVVDTVLNVFDNPLIISLRWRLNLEGTRFNNLEGGVEHGRHDGLNIVTYDISEPVDIFDHVQTYLSSLSENRKLVIVNQIPEAGWDVFAYALWRFASANFDEEISTSYYLYRSANARVIDLLAQLEPNTTFIKTDNLICSNETERCLNTINGVPLYRDNNHPSPLFSEMIASEIVAALTRSGVVGVSDNGGH